MKVSSLLAVLALVLVGCTAEVREADLLRPVRGGGLSAEALAKAAPRYAMSEERIAAEGGATLYAVHLRQPGAKATVLYFGGNGYTIGRFGAWTASVFAPLAVDLFIVDHRGYGLSTGTPALETMGPDGAAAFDHLARKLGPGGRIVVHGQSLGSFVAGDLAAARAAAGVVLESSATTAEEWMKVATPSMARAFVKVRLDPKLYGRGNLTNMGRIDEPLLLLVGEKDGTTPPVLSRALYAASPLPPERKTLVEVRGANHVNVMTKPQTIAAYRDFLARLPER